MKIARAKLLQIIREELERLDDLQEEDLEEDAAEGFEGTAKAMKRHKEIDNPWALTHWMKKQGYKSHRTKSGKKRRGKKRD